MAANKVTRFAEWRLIYNTAWECGEAARKDVIRHTLSASFSLPSHFVGCSDFFCETLVFPKSFFLMRFENECRCGFASDLGTLERKFLQIFGRFMDPDISLV